MQGTRSSIISATFLEYCLLLGIYGVRLCEGLHILHYLLHSGHAAEDNGNSRKSLKELKAHLALESSGFAASGLLTGIGQSYQPAASYRLH